MPLLALRVRMLLVPAVLAAVPAYAQISADPSARPPSRNGRPAVAPNFSSRAVAPWPQLDPGAVLCRTRDDLVAHARAVQARVEGQPGVALATPNCRIIAEPTAIDVVTRESPAATEVRVKGASNTGWTDTWLPAQAPR